MVLKMARPWRDPRTGTYYCRKKIHESLRPFMGGGWEYKRSLQTKDPKEALSRFPQALAEANAVFELARKAKEGSVQLNARDAQQLAARWFANERKRLELSGDWQHWLVIVQGRDGEEADTLHSFMEDEKERQSVVNAVVLPAVADMLKTQGQAMPAPQTPLYAQLVEVFTSHALDMSSWALDNWAAAGRYVPAPAIAPYAPTSVEVHAVEAVKAADTEPKRQPGEPIDILTANPSEVFLRDVLEDWSKHGKAGRQSYPPKTVKKYEACVKRFEALTGNPSMSEIERWQGTALKRALLALEGDDQLTPTTVRNTLVNIGSLLNYYSTQTGHIGHGLWRNISNRIVEEPHSEVRDEWTEEELAKLFGLPVWRSYALPTAKNAGADAAYWVPLLGLYTGARITELCQLRIDDFSEKDGCWMMRLAVTDEAQSLKAAASWREIPLPAELLELGLLQYRADIQALGQEWLFPAVNKSAQNNAGGGLSSWFSKMKIAEGFRKEVVFHSLRGTLNTQLARKGIPLEMRCKFIGQKPEGGVNVSHYTKLKPKDLIPTAEAVSFAFLNLPKVYTKPAWSA